MFTNYVEKFPANKLAPLAQKWVADFHFQSGKFSQSEKSYRQIFENTNYLNFSKDLIWEARLSAARSAFFNQEYETAQLLLDDIIKATNAPIDEVARAEFYLGDVISEQTDRTPTNLIEAVVHYQKVAREMTNSSLNTADSGASSLYTSTFYFRTSASRNSFFKFSDLSLRFWCFNPIF